MKKEILELVNKGEMLPLMEAFYTIQGEGYHKGTAAYFVRIGGCDVGCHWCDVKESWNAEEHPFTPFSSLVSNVLKSKTDFVVITGGEPAMYDISNLVNAIKELSAKVTALEAG